MSIQNYHALKIKAHTEHDLTICSSYLQDALCPLSAIHFDKEKNCFSMLTNRFCWETIDFDSPHHVVENKEYHRVHCGLIFHGAQAVFKRNFHQQGKDRVLNILTLTYTLETSSINILFSEDKELKINIDPVLPDSSFLMLMEDFDAPWPTKKRVQHWHEHEALFEKKEGMYA